MTRSFQTTIAATCLLIFSLAASLAFLRRSDLLRTDTAATEVLFVPSATAVRRMSLGYDGLMADIYWTRAVQYFGNHHAVGARHFALLAPLLNIATQLDPHLVVAYDFGANFLSPPPPNGAGDPQAAVQLTEFGIKENPNEWKLYYNLGFIYYLELHQYADAAQAFQHGAQLPGAHPFMKVLAAQMAEHAGEISTARMLWATTYDSTKDKDIRANAMAHLRALKVDEDVTALEDLLDKYKQSHGVYATSFNQLITAGMISGVPLDPMNQPYQILPNGVAAVKHPDDFPFVQRGYPPGYTPPKIPKVLPQG